MSAVPKLTYGEQLKHPNWQRKRLEILTRDDFKCRQCFDTESMLHVHHKRYVKGRMAWEYEGDELVSLCDSCHKQQHSVGEQFSKLMAVLANDGPFSTSDAQAMVAGWAAGVHPVESTFFMESRWSFALGALAAVIDDIGGQGLNAADLDALAFCLQRPAFLPRLKEAMVETLRESSDGR